MSKPLLSSPSASYRHKCAVEAAAIAAEAAAAAESAAAEVGVSVFAQFERVDGEKVGPTVDLPISVTGRDMDLVLNVLAMASSEQKYEFFVGGVQVTALRMQRSQKLGTVLLFFNLQRSFSSTPPPTLTSDPLRGLVS